MPDLLFLEPVGGAAGDMFLAAALDLGVPRADLERALHTLSVPFRLEVTRAEAGGVGGTHVEVVPEGPEPGHRHLADIVALIRKGGLPPRARDAALALFDRIGRAEAKVHGIPLDEVHFHEVGGLDSIVDVCGAAVVMDLLGWPRAVSLAPELGHGFQKTAHGRLPVPVPATLEILAGKPVRHGGPPGEAVTPTGAAILAVLFEIGAPPAFTPRRIGYGVGTSRWPDRPNVLRLTLGDEVPTTVRPSTPASQGEASAHGEPPSVHPERSREAAESKGEGDALWRPGLFELSTNLDDCPGQLVARAIEVALAAGAVDAWVAPVTMKKGRPGLVLSALADLAHRDAVARAFLAETTTLGVRCAPVERVELAREHVTVETAYGPVRVKEGRLGGALLSAHPEYDDCVARAGERGATVKEVMAAALAAHRARR
ncbi:MAG: nickel pincer cofactor biosynthesis protein LarC [Anaeromyxobacteraceae bacterium]